MLHDSTMASITGGLLEFILWPVTPCTVVLFTRIVNSIRVSGYHYSLYSWQTVDLVWYLPYYVIEASFICVRHYAGQKILGVSVAQPITCHHYTGECVLEALEVGNWGVRRTECRKAGLWVSQAPWNPFQAALWAYSGTFWVAPPGHTLILRLRNLWHISKIPYNYETDSSVLNLNPESFW